MEHGSRLPEAARLDAFADIDIPDALRPSVERHRANLFNLLQTLKLSGVSTAMIEASTAAVVESYKAELLAAVKNMMKSDTE